MERMRLYHCRRCSLCGREITPGEEYWVCNGTLVCRACLADFARQELAFCREICGKETIL